MTREVEKIFTYRCNIPGCQREPSQTAAGFIGWTWKEGRLVPVAPQSESAQWHSCLSCSDVIMTVRGKMIDNPPKNIPAMKERGQEMVNQYALRASGDTS